jgi:hypothetical protein
MKDFSRARPTVSFKIDDDVFTGVPAMSADDMVALVATFADMDEDDPVQVAKTIKDIVRNLLDSRSADRFVNRMGDRVQPIEFDQANEVILWLMGEYGMRPTEQPSPSGSGPASPASGTNLTEPTSVAVSTSSPSLGTSS